MYLFLQIPVHQTSNAWLFRCYAWNPLSDELVCFAGLQEYVGNWGKQTHLWIYAIFDPEAIF